MSTISRRAFLKTVGVGALSVAAMSVLAGCDTVVPGTTEEVVTGTVEVAFNKEYLAGEYVLSTDAAATAVTYTDTWATTFSSSYVTALGAKDEDPKATATKEADEAVKDLGGALAKVDVKIKNLSETILVLATTAVSSAPSNYDAVKNNTSIFTASANGQKLDCTVVATTPYIDADPDGSETATTVSCYVAVPSNTKEFTFNVTLGGKTLSYTVENNNYVDLSKY